MENSKPTYYFNGYAAYKNFYLISPEISFSRFKEIVDNILRERAYSKKPEWLAKIQKFIADNFDENIQVFFTPNWTGDPMEFVKTIGKASIYYCSYYGYIEVLGLSKAERDLAIDFMINEWKGESQTSYLRDGKIGEIR